MALPLSQVRGSRVPLRRFSSTAPPLSFQLPTSPTQRARSICTCAEPPKVSTQATILDNPTTSSKATYAHRPRTVQDLKDPARIGASGRAVVKVKDHGGDVSLSSYMLLPVEQYFVLDPSQIRFISGNRFELLVPRINIFNIWLEPVVEVSVSATRSPPRVVLQAENARIFGSESIEALKLDQKFVMKFVTELSWQAGQGGPEGIPGELVGNARLDVWSEVIPPFHIMPKEMLVASCNAVMAGLVNSLLPLFVRKLGADYQKWAVDPVYRQQRSQRSKPLSV